MSAQFGICSLDGPPVERSSLGRIHQMLSPYGPDAEGSFNSANAAILFRAFHTTTESESEVQPYVSADLVITWDGRLDNREDLRRSLDQLSSSATDLDLVTAAYERWGKGCLPRLIGDWAIAVWNQRERSLTLARDFIGTRHLYYWAKGGQVAWSTILDPLLLLAGDSLAIEEEYLAGWLASLPPATLSPYTDIRAVPPAHLVVFQSGKTIIHKYWDFDPGKRVCYKRDEEYEESFREYFSAAVNRRLRSNRPVLAELSGGMDSSSIVCTADELMAHHRQPCPRLDTISYYDDSEPNWNERPYFSLVEQKRGRAGFHIDISQVIGRELQTPADRVPVTPAYTQLSPVSAELRGKCVSGNQNRVLLSGVGGDEVTGGVPSPVPELADLLQSRQWRSFAGQLKSWSLETRMPCLHLLASSVGRFLPGQKSGIVVPWLKEDFVNRHPAAFRGYASRVKVFGGPPSLQENLFSIESLRRQLGCGASHSEPLLEKRFPYLDRDLLELLFAMPREQMLRPGQRRSLLRRSMANTVPVEILQRRRKAYVARVPQQLFGVCDQLSAQGQWVSGSLGIIDSAALKGALAEMRGLQSFPVVALTRTLGLELWLRANQHRFRPHATLRPREQYASHSSKGVLANSHNLDSQLERR